MTKLALILAALLAALGWRLQGWELAAILGILGLSLAVWIDDIPVRRILREDRKERDANRLAVSAIRDYAKAHENLRTRR